MSSTGQEGDKGVTRGRQEGDKRETPAQAYIAVDPQILATLASLTTIGQVTDTGYVSFYVDPYSDQTPARLPPFPPPATVDVVPPRQNGELYTTHDAIAYVQRQLEEDTARLRLTRLEAEAAAVRRELLELQPRTQACLRCGRLFNEVKADGTVDVKVGKRRMYCIRADGGSISGSEECVKEREAQRQRDYRAKKLARRQSE